VHWRPEDSLVQTRYFRFNDEPTAKGLTIEEVESIQNKLLENASLPTSTEEYKHKESRWEAESLKSV
jgi:hypothetical protein